MTGTDLLSLGQVTPQTNVDMTSSKASSPEEMIASAFSNLMNQIQSGNVVSTPSATSNLQTQTSDVDSSSFDKFQYQNAGSKITKPDDQNVEAKVEEAKEPVEVFEKEVVSQVAQATGLEEDDVVNAMEELGLSIMDLLNPQNLATLFTNLTGENQPAAILLNENFQNLMTDVNQMAQELMQNLNVDADGLQEIVAQMEVLDQPVTFEGILENVETELVDFGEKPQADYSTPVVEVEVASDEKLDALDEVKPEETVDQTENLPIIESEEKDSEDLMEEGTEETEVDFKQEVKTETEGHSSDSNQHQTEANTETSTMNVSQPDNSQAIQPTATTTYTQVTNVLEMIERVAENVKAIISSESQTMEMQLNPENLGKLFLQVTQKEGAVSAQITAQNENVKDALLAQIATLQDKLNQAGVKVDAIEVTVSTHEFEQNLEQDGRRDEENASNQETRSGRRNLNLNDLDGLSGLMSEEETLVAQMMKDNGNSVDLTA